MRTLHPPYNDIGNRDKGYTNTVVSEAATLSRGELAYKVPGQGLARAVWQDRER